MTGYGSGPYGSGRYGTGELTPVPVVEGLRLEIEADPTGLINLVQNPSGEFGGWGWITEVAGSAMTSTTVGSNTFLTYKGVAGPSYFTTESLPVSAGQWVAAQWIDAGGSAVYYRARLEWINAAGSPISSSAQGAYYSLAAVTRTYTATQAPAGTAYVRLRYDVYQNTSGAHPTGAHTMHLAPVIVAKAASSGALVTVRTNICANPSFETNISRWTDNSALYGESIKIARSTAQAATGSASLAISGMPPSGPYYRNTFAQYEFTAQGGYDYSATAALRCTSNVAASGSPISISFQWLDASDTPLGGGTGSRYYNNTSPSTWVEIATNPATAPANAVKGRFRVNIQNSLNASGVIAYLDKVLIEQATTAGAYIEGTVTSGALNADPVQYVNVLGASHDIKVARSELDVGTLTATVVSSTLDPAKHSLIRPGRRVRLVSLIGGQWEPVFTGKATKASVDYALLQPEEKRARIQLTAVDAVSTLAQAARPEGVGTIGELAYVLEGAGVPWSVNGSGSQVPTASVVSVADDSTTALDQCAITRDSCAPAAVWVDRRGVLQAWDSAALSSTLRATLDEMTYGDDFDLDYSTERCVNSVVVKARMTAYGQTSEETYGPYEDADSIATWGRRSATFTVHGIAEGAIPAYAAAILAANATPAVQVNSLSLLVPGGDLSLSTIDLYDLLRVVNARAEIDQQMRVTSIEHSIVADTKRPDGGRWVTRLTFGSEGSVAAPVVTPPLPSTGRVADTGWLTPAFQSGWTDFGDGRDVQYRRIGNRVTMRGIAKSGTVGSGSPIFTLPEDCRPPHHAHSDQHWPVASNGGLGLVGVTGGTGPEGGWVCLHVGSNAYVDLSPVTYLVDG